MAYHQYLWRSYVAILAIAVSGGVDSMALAHLCRKLQGQDPSGLRFRVMIVDHQARQNSSQEARLVALSLRKIGLATTILKLNWSTESFPLRLQNFETLARVKRYRALGLACRNYRINSLLLAHHEDDQVETILMRLHAHQTGQGLRGIQPAAGIPECHGIYGVHESGNIQSPEDLKLPFPIRSTAEAGEPSIQPAGGGVSVLRPLLAFSKDRLVATCQAETIPWHEDVTNSDKTLTLRNTIRHVLKDQQLPRALQKKAVLRVGAMTRDLWGRSDHEADTMLQALRVVSFDLRSGMLTFRQPLELPNGTRATAPLRIVLRFLSRIAAVVSPNKQISDSGLLAIARHMFSNLFEGDEKTSCKPHVVITAAGIIWERSVCASIDPNKNARVWRLSRQPHASEGLQPHLLWASTEHQASVEVKLPWTWQMFDGRYWIRAATVNNQVVSARLLRSSDMHYLHNTLPKAQRKKLQMQLAGCAPGNVRWTLPILADAITDTILALPTLGIRMPNNDHDVRWEIQYKCTKSLQASGVPRIRS